MNSFLRNLSYFILQRLGLWMYGFASLLESVLNIILYITFIDNLVKVFDFSIPFYFWWSDRVLKGEYLNKLRKEND